MAYAPDVPNQPPYTDPNYDPAAEPTPDNPNVFTPPEQQALLGPDGLPILKDRPQADPGATSYDYSGGKASV